MGENVPVEPRAEFLARIRRFTDETLDNLNAASRGKDADEKEVRALRSILLKLLKIWDKALFDGQRDPRLVEILRQVEKQPSQVKTGEA